MNTSLGIRPYTRGLHELGDGLYAWLQPDGSWGWSNAGLVCDGGEALLVDKEAEKWYLAAIELIEKISSPLSPNQEIQIAHFSGVNSVYNSLAELYLRQGRGEEAFIIIDKSKSRNTKANLERLKLLSHFKDNADYNKLIDLEWMISSGLYEASAIDSLMKVISGFKSNLLSMNKDMKEILIQNNSSNLNDMKLKLNEIDYIVSVYVGNGFLTLFNLSSKGLSFEKINICSDSLLLIAQIGFTNLSIGDCK